MECVHDVKIVTKFNYNKIDSQLLVCFLLSFFLFVTFLHMTNARFRVKFFVAHPFIYLLVMMSLCELCGTHNYSIFLSH